MKLVRLLARSLSWALLSTVIFLVSCQSMLIYHPKPYSQDELSKIERLGGKRIEVKTSQGLQTAFYLPSRHDTTRPPQFLWLVFGGNGSLALDYADEAAGWDARFGYLFVDYPSYGLCEGRPTPATIEESIVALTGSLQTGLHWSDAEFRKRTGIIGHSLGCAAGLIAADHLQLRGAVLCAPFTTMTDMAKRVVGWPLCYINRHRFDNIARLQTLSARGAQVRIFHGTKDRAIPISMSRKLAEIFPQTVRLTEVVGCGHDEIVSVPAADIGTAMQELCRNPAR